MIISFFEREVLTRWNSKFCRASFERWHVIIIIYLTERWIAWRSRFILYSSHFKDNPSNCEIDVKHQKHFIFESSTSSNVSREIPHSLVTHQNTKLSFWGQHLLSGPEGHLFDSARGRAQFSFLWTSLWTLLWSTFVHWSMKLFTSSFKDLRKKLAPSWNETAGTSFSPCLISRFWVSSIGKLPTVNAFFISLPQCLLSDLETRLNSIIVREIYFSQCLSFSLKFTCAPHLLKSPLRYLALKLFQTLSPSLSLSPCQQFSLRHLILAK